jgi:hypothetical protein
MAPSFGKAGGGMAGYARGWWCRLSKLPGRERRMSCWQRSPAGRPSRNSMLRQCGYAHEFEQPQCPAAACTAALRPMVVPPTHHSPPPTHPPAHPPLRDGPPIPSRVSYSCPPLVCGHSVHDDTHGVRVG